MTAGVRPAMVSDILLELLPAMTSGEQALIARVFDKPSLNINHLRERSDMDHSELLRMLDSLMYDGIVRSTGIIIYRLLRSVADVLREGPLITVSPVFRRLSMMADVPAAKSVSWPVPCRQLSWWLTGLLRWKRSVSAVVYACQCPADAIHMKWMETRQVFVRSQRITWFSFLIISVMITVRIFKHLSELR